MRALLISIKPHHASNIKDGSKTVELRRIAPKISGGMWALIYESAPVMAVTALAYMSGVTTSPLADLWRQHGPATRISEAEYYAYYAGLAQASGLHIRRVWKLKAPVPLAWLRAENLIQNPPQSYRYLPKQHLRPLLAGYFARIGITA